MSHYEWNENNIRCLKKSFLRTVLINLGTTEGAFVKFGTQGEGTKPNYQIHFANGVKVPYRFPNSQANDIDEWDENHLSNEQFTFKMIKGFCEDIK